jgi:uncharacterized protein (TIGR02466 family)
MENNCLEFWFPTPIYYNNIPDNGILNKFISSYELYKTNNQFQGPLGWNSHLISDPTFSTNFLDNHLEFCQQLDIHIQQYLKMTGAPIVPYRIISSWMTLTGKGNYGRTHVHGDSDISGVFYVKTSGKDGNIFFENPNKTLRNSFCFRHFQQNITYSPEVGRLMLFPGWLEHGIETNTTDHERVSVSFNIVFDRFSL